MGELEIFAIRIKQLRESKQMTQKEFSEHIGIKQQTLSGYERGLMKPPLDIAKIIAEKCNISIDWLCGLTDKTNYDDSIKTYSDVIGFLYRLEQTEIGMEVMNIPKLEHPMFKSIVDVPVIAFNNMEMCDFLWDFEEIKGVKGNMPIDKLYKLWIKDTLEKYDKKLQYDGIIEAYERLTNPDSTE